MMEELRSDEPYEVAAGCPTITFELADGSLMLGYSSFASGQFKGGRIELGFQDWRIEIEGDNLTEVWRLLQMQDLRAVRLSIEGIADRSRACRISLITVERSSER